MPKIAIFAPKEVLQKYYWNNEKIIFIELDNWSLVKNKERVKVPVENIFADNHWNNNLPVRDIIQRFKEFSPIWSRWTDRGDQFELHLRQALIEAHDVCSGLEKLNVKTVIFPTAASHHLDSMIIETACVMAGVKQVFPYTVYSSQYNSKYGRLLPLIQTKDIKDRVPIDIPVSEYNHDTDIDKLLEFSRNQTNNNAFSNSFSKSFFLATLVISISGLRNKLYKILRFKNLSSESCRIKFAQFPKYSTTTHLKQIYQQRKALKYYRVTCSPSQNISIEKLENDDNILLVAHYQPEATSFPEGWDSHNHIDIIYELKRKGFKGNILYKEHPATILYTADVVGPTRVGQYRSKDYYKQLEKLGCILLDPSFELSLNYKKSYWYLPITVSGTIAIERSLSGLHTIITGYPWYKGLPGTIHLSEIRSLSKIDSSWKKQDSRLAKSAAKFLKTRLNKKTILNALSIGTGVKIDDHKLISDFMEEYDTLVRALIVDKKNDHFFLEIYGYKD